MGVRDININPAAAAAILALDASPATIVINQAAKRCFAWVATFAGLITNIEVYASGVTANLSFDCKNNAGTSVLTTPAVPVADTVVTASLVASLATKRFKKGDTISVYYTTDGAGAAVNPSIVLSVRPFPMNGESAVGP